MPPIFCQNFCTYVAIGGAATPAKTASRIGNGIEAAIGFR
jgi:hypothetical protein